jgi:hypothetical protein
METRAADAGRRAALRGRVDECALLDGLLADVRRRAGRSLVLRGEAGIGKTALLEYLIESACETTVLRAVGVEAEMELAYASLHQLCAPLLDRLEGLPAPQRDAPRVVFGITDGVPPDRLLVGLGMLSLLSEVAEERRRCAWSMTRRVSHVAPLGWRPGGIPPGLRSRSAGRIGVSRAGACRTRLRVLDERERLPRYVE